MKINNKIITRLARSFVFIFILSFAFNLVPAHAIAPYRTFTIDGNGMMVETQTAYIPVGRLNVFGDITLDNASGMQIVDDILYIADTQNRRIIVSDLEGNLIRIIGEGMLDHPGGLFVTPDHRIYVADERNEKIHVFDRDGNHIIDYGRPDHPLFGDNAPFRPQKVVVDGRQNIFVISQGNTNGIIQLSQANNGEFLGYFGVNRTRVSVLQVFQDLIFSEEQRQQLFPRLPATTTNMDIDSRGLVHTVTEGDQFEMLAKLNMAGVDMLGPTQWFANPTDVLVGPYGNIFVATASGFIIEYTSEGDVLFIFGGQDMGDQRVGLFNTVSAIALDSQHRLFVLDSRLNEIQIFQRTEFAEIVHEALVYYQEGLYYLSRGPWERVLEMNSLFSFAHVGLGEALFQAHEYQGARQAFRMGLHLQGYSDAFWEIRNTWLRTNLPTVFTVLLLAFIAWKIIKYFDKKNNILEPVKKGLRTIGDIKIIKELNYIWTFIKHPIDGFYGLKYENKVSNLSTTIWGIIMIVIFLINRYQTGFIFTNVVDGQYNVALDVIIVLGVFGLLVASHYLIATITEGEGKFRHVYWGVIHSLMPFVLLTPFSTILSNVLTFNETFILTFMGAFTIGWIAVLLFFFIKDIHNFSVREVIKNVFITIFTALMFVLILFILYVLFMQLYGFISATFREAVNRFGPTI